MRSFSEDKILAPGTQVQTSSADSNGQVTRHDAANDAAFLSVPQPCEINRQGTLEYRSRMQRPVIFLGSSIAAKYDLQVGFSGYGCTS